MNATELLLLLCLLGAAWYWYDSIKARELALRVARQTCIREGVQLLDDTIACRSQRPSRADNGHLQWSRVYDFEYSGNGDDRYRGSVMIVGREVALLDVSEHRQRLVM